MTKRPGAEGIQPWPTVSEETIGRYSIFSLSRSVRSSPRSGRHHVFLRLDAPDWVNVIALTPAAELVLVEQYRHGTDSVTLEIPGGVVNAGEPAQAAAERELREESGFEAGEMRFLGTANPNPAIFTNTCGTFLATDCHRVGDVQPDPGEDLEVVTLDKAGLKAAIHAGEVDHALVLAAFAWLEFTDGAPRLA